MRKDENQWKVFWRASSQTYLDQILKNGRHRYDPNYSRERESKIVEDGGNLIVFHRVVEDKIHFCLRLGPLFQVANP